MGRLDELDLSLSLSREEEAERLKDAERRLLELRLALGGKLDPDDPRIGPAGVRPLRGLGRLRQGRGDQAPGRAARPAPRARRAVRGADVRREAPPLPLAFLAGAAGLGRHGRVRPLLVRAGAGRAGRGLRDHRAVEARLRRDRRVRALALPRGHDPRQVLAAHLRRGAARAVRAAREGPAQALEAHRRGLAQPREAPRLRARRRGHARAHRPRARRTGSSSRPTRSATRA